MIRFLVFIELALFMNIHLHAKSLHPRVSRNAVKDPSRRWPDGIVYYTIDDAFSDAENVMIRQVMKEIESASCVRFKTRTYQKAYLEIRKGDTCDASTGYSGRHQRLTVSQSCIYPAVIYMLLFSTLGFYNEHHRPDRDKYVFVDEKNIKPELLWAFKKKSDSEIETFGLPYDFKSVMHYSPNVFAIDPSKPNLISRSGVSFSGSADKMTDLDAFKLIKLYRCQERRKG